MEMLFQSIKMTKIGTLISLLCF